MQYTLRHPPRSKRITLKVEYPDQIMVSAPKRVSKKVIEKFIEQNQAWIQTQISKLKKRHDHVHSDHQVMIFGNPYQITHQQLPAEKRLVFVHQQGLVVNLPDSSSIRTIKQEIKNFLKQAARSYLYERTPQLAEQMKVNYKALKLKEQKTRWGSCSSQDNLNLNWRLVHYSTPVIDYVIIHELAHLVHRNHSRSFWKLVAQHCPEYKEHRSYLKRFGVTHT